MFVTLLLKKTSVRITPIQKNNTENISFLCCFKNYVSTGDTVSRITSYLVVLLVHFSGVLNILIACVRDRAVHSVASSLPFKVCLLYSPIFQAASLVLNVDLSSPLSSSVLFISSPLPLSPCLGALGQVWLMMGAKGDPWILIIKTQHALSLHHKHTLQ